MNPEIQLSTTCIKTRILWFVTPINHSVIMGGTLGRIKKWYHQIDKTKFEIFVLLSGRNRSNLEMLQTAFRRENVIIDVIPKICLPDVLFPGRSRKFLNYISCIRPDIIHSMFIQSDLIAALYKDRSRIPIAISSLEGALYPKTGCKSQIYKIAYEFLKNRLDTIIALSQYTKYQAIMEYRAPWDKCHLIYSGINPLMFEYPKTINREPAKLSIGYLGNIGLGKRIDLFIDTIAQLASQGRRYRFVVGGIGPELDRIISKAKSLNIYDLIEFRGYVSDVSDFFTQIDIFVFLSEREGLPWVILESQAAGVPTIASPVGAVPEVIKSGHNGILIETHTSNYLARTINELATDFRLRQKFSQNSRTTIEKSFHAKTEMKHLECLYETMIHRKGAFNNALPRTPRGARKMPTNSPTRTGY